jgi:diacylglycerol kinase family enzyme
MAEAGLGGAVARRTAVLPAVLGRARTFVGFWSAVASFRPVGATLAGDRRTWEGRVHDVIVANGQYLRDAMRLSPKSWPDDGFFEVLVMTGPKSDSFTIIPKSYLGEHLPHPNIVEYRSRTLRIETARPVPVHLDGVPTGSTPVRFDLLPKALRLKT